MADRDRDAAAVEHARQRVIGNRAGQARPQSVSLIDWNLEPAFSEATFRFTPPKGAIAVEIGPREAK